MYFPWFSRFLPPDMFSTQGVDFFTCIFPFFFVSVVIAWMIVLVWVEVLSWVVVVVVVRLMIITSGDEADYYSFTQYAVEYIHIVDPSKWQIIPYAACRLESHGVVLKQIGAPVGLIKSSLMGAHNFTQADLTMFARFYELDGMHTNDAMLLLDILGNHLKGEDESYPEVIKSK